MRTSEVLLRAMLEGQGTDSVPRKGRDTGKLNKSKGGMGDV